MDEFEFDIESGHIREVFANYGLALYQAQCLEKQIAIILGGRYETKPHKMTKYRYDEILDSHMEHTFGRVVHDLQAKMSLSQEINNKLELAVEKRNWLSHYYWWDRVSEFNSHDGRLFMINELKEIAELFEELDEHFMEIAKTWLNDIGITPEVLTTCQAELLAKPTPIRVGTRKLKKVENLIRVYQYKKYDQDRRRTIILELDDHTFCTLCDIGLICEIEDISIDRLTSDKRFADKLPAAIQPRPKDAANWNYRIPLSTGYYIKVTPYEGNEGYACTWGLYSKKDNKLVKLAEI